MSSGTEQDRKALTLRENLLEALVLPRPLLVLRLQGLHLGCVLRCASSKGHALTNLPEPTHAHSKTAILQLFTSGVSPLSTACSPHVHSNAAGEASPLTIAFLYKRHSSSRKESPVRPGGEICAL